MEDKRKRINLKKSFFAFYNDNDECVLICDTITDLLNYLKIDVNQYNKRKYSLTLCRILKSKNRRTYLLKKPTKVYIYDKN
jgi:hypothetical protein